MATMTRQASITADLVAALDGAWRSIQQRHPQVPDVVLTLGSGTLGVKAGQERLGHFAAGRWQHATQHATQRVPELFVSGEGLRKGALDVLGVLLHEAAHGLAHTREIKDTSRQGRYHNTRYKALAVELGLAVATAGRIGWSDTTVPATAAEQYRTDLAVIEGALVAYRHPETRTGTGTGRKNKNGTVARCDCARQFRITTSVLALGPITCGVCGTEFTSHDQPDEDEDED